MIVETKMFRLPRQSKFLFVAIFFFAVSMGFAQQPQQKNEKGPAELPGKQWFHAYCASCHGEDAKGHDPSAAQKNPPADLTTLAKRNKGKFPADYVKKVLNQGVSVPAHGTSDMPVWGHTFADINARDLIRYLESVQAK
jgi:mono/diheme cytochrome c family protein